MSTGMPLTAPAATTRRAQRSSMRRGSPEDVRLHLLTFLSNCRIVGTTLHETPVLVHTGEKRGEVKPEDLDRTMIYAIYL